MSSDPSPQGVRPKKPPGHNSSRSAKRLEVANPDLPAAAGNAAHVIFNEEPALGPVSGVDTESVSLFTEVASLDNQYGSAGEYPNLTCLPHGGLLGYSPFFFSLFFRLPDLRRQSITESIELLGRP